MAIGDNHTEEPNTLEEALASQHSREWKEAADSEYQSLVDNDTWDLVELPANRTAIGCKWVFKAKTGSDDAVNRYKGRLVAKGYIQKYGVKPSRQSFDSPPYEHCSPSLCRMI